MKKYIATIALIGLTFVSQSFGATVTLLVQPGTFTNLLSVQGSAKVTQISVAATTATNTTVALVDCPTNQLTYVVPAYTNVLSYATNIVVSWTNYFGVVNYSTNTYALVRVTNSVASVTNNYPIRSTISSLGGTTTTTTGVNYWFVNGLWVTNTSGSPGPAAVTITYQQ